LNNTKLLEKEVKLKEINKDEKIKELETRLEKLEEKKLNQMIMLKILNSFLK